MLHIYLNRGNCGPTEFSLGWGCAELGLTLHTLDEEATKAARLGVSRKSRTPQGTNWSIHIGGKLWELRCCWPAKQDRLEGPPDAEDSADCSGMSPRQMELTTMAREARASLDRVVERSRPKVEPAAIPAE